MEKKDFDFESELKRVDKLVRDLMMDDGVMSDSALYGLLLAASFALSNAVCHAREHLVFNDLKCSLCNE